MSEIEEERKESNEEAEVEEKESIDNPEELEAEKRNFNEFNAKENTADAQLFVQSLDKLCINYYYDKGKNVQKETKEEKTYDLKNQQDCVKFIEKYNGSEYLLVAVVLCMFEFVTLGDLPKLRIELASFLPQMVIKEGEDENTLPYQSNPYLSMNSIFHIIGAEQFTIAGGQQCAGFGKESNRVIINIWEQFPALREPIILWLIHLNEIYKIETGLRTYQIATAFERIISLDITDAQRKIFPRLYQSETNVGLLGFLLYKLHCNELLEKTANTIMKQWLETNSEWYWKSACLSYFYHKENEEVFLLEKQLKDKIRKEVRYFKDEDYNFLASLLQKSKHFRVLFISVLNAAYNDKDARGRVREIYFKLVRMCYYRVNVRYMELPMVCCDTALQQEQLKPMIEDIMHNYYMRRRLYAILRVYLKELSGYKVQTKTLMHISAFFYNLSLVGMDYKPDVINLLETCENKVSEQILQTLKSIETKEEENYE